MKKILLLAIATGLLSFTTVKVPADQNVKEQSELDCNYGQCRATAKSTGNQCMHCVSNSGDYYCYQHK